jgi:hypothetical protein
MSRASIRQRVEAATEGPWELVHDDAGFADVCTPIGYTLMGVNLPSDGDFAAHARQDIPLLLAVADAAADAELTCDDMCQAYLDEPCTCGRAAIRDALAALDAQP